MEVFNTQENRIKCGRCGTEFDLSKNKEGCPLCGLRKELYKGLRIEQKIVKEETKPFILDEFLSVPPSLKLTQGKVNADDGTEVWGSWLMFNDFFAPKFLARVLAWKIKKENSEYIVLNSLIEDAVKLIEKYELSRFKGFPNRIKKPNNLQKDNAVCRLVYHFLWTAIDMGFFKEKPVDSKVKDEKAWSEPWEKIEITLTKEGLEFAQLKNLIFDENKNEQMLSPEEKKWLIDYLKEIDKQGYREYSTLKDVYDFLKEGHNGNQDLWAWFENNKKFQDYILQTSKRAKDDPKIFQKQLHNYARTFASAKISLLRELGVVKNKRNDYTLIGEI